jgi:hypothetical protein
MTYNKEEFQNLINDILHKAGYDVKINLLLLIDQEAKKWWNKSYTRDFTDITENTTYGVKYEGDIMLQYDFKTGKIDNLLKMFITCFASKHRTVFVDDNGKVVYETNKKEVLKTIVEKNQNRVSKGLFYTTLYGIGFWAIFCMKEDVETAKELAEYLKSKSVDYRNEWSDAGWVYRFVIGKDVEVHNNLLKEFKK